MTLYVHFFYDSTNSLRPNYAGTARNTMDYIMFISLFDITISTL